MRVWYWIVVMVIDMGLLFELPRSLNISTGITVLVVLQYFSSRSSSMSVYGGRTLTGTGRGWNDNLKAIVPSML